MLLQEFIPDTWQKKIIDEVFINDLETKTTFFNPGKFVAHLFPQQVSFL
jgi:hypothetical protein